MDINVKVVRNSESLFKQHVGGNNFRDPKITWQHGTKTITKYHTRRELSNINVLEPLDNHHFENCVVNEDFHSTQLGLAIADFYFDTRLLNYGKFIIKLP